MNEKIFKLALKAMDFQGAVDIDTELKLTNSELEKFAELIVRECCNKIERKYKYALGEKTQWAMSQDVQDLLKEHFGVEE